MHERQVPKQEEENLSVEQAKALIATYIGKLLEIKKFNVSEIDVERLGNRTIIRGCCSHGSETFELDLKYYGKSLIP